MWRLGRLTTLLALVPGIEKDTDIDDGHEEVWDDADAVSFPFLGFSGRPVESVQDVLTEGGEEPIGHLVEAHGVNDWVIDHYQPINGGLISVTSSML